MLKVGGWLFVFMVDSNSYSGSKYLALVSL